MTDYEVNPFDPFEKLDQDIREGKVSLKELLYRRIALTELGIPSLDTEIAVPQELYDEVETVQAELDELQKLSREEIVERANAWNEEMRAFNTHELPEEVKQEYVKNIMEYVDTLESQEFEDTDFQDNLHFVQMHCRGMANELQQDLGLPTKSLTPDEWYIETVQRTVDSLQNRIATLQNEIARAEENNEYRLKLKEKIDANF